MVRQRRNKLPIINVSSVKLGISVKRRLRRHPERRNGPLDIIVVTMSTLPLGMMLIVRRVMSSPIRFNLGRATMLTTPNRQRQWTNGRNRLVLRLLKSHLV